MQLTHWAAGQLLYQLHSHSCHDLAVLTYHYLHLLYSPDAATLAQLHSLSCTWLAAYANQTQQSGCNWASAAERLKLSDFNWATEAERTQLSECDRVIFTNQIASSKQNVNKKN